MTKFAKAVVSFVWIVWLSVVFIAIFKPEFGINPRIILIYGLICVFVTEICSEF